MRDGWVACPEMQAGRNRDPQARDWMAQKGARETDLQIQGKDEEAIKRVCVWGGGGADGGRVC